MQWQITFRREVIYESRTCPLPKVRPWAHEMVRLYGHFERGRYPLGGGLLEQPNAYIKAMELLGEVFAEIKAERAARQERTRRE